MFSIQFYDQNLQYESSIVGGLCGNFTPAPIESKSDILLVRFNSDRLVSYRGFSGTISFVASGKHHENMSV